jgi:UDP-N-acetylglucosamine:LPS N-acetylglucosamine transferase
MFDISNRLAYTVIKAMTKLPEYYLIIKIHPEEKIDFYQKLLNQFGLKALIVEDIELLYDLISLSELVISAEDSTVGLQVTMLHKPLICVNLSKLPHCQDYAEKGVAIGVRHEEDLLPTIKSIIEDEKIRKKLERNRKRYIYEHAYKQDGKASERVVKLINKILLETEKEKK